MQVKKLQEEEVWVPEFKEFGIRISQSAWTRCVAQRRMDGAWAVQGLYVTPDYRNMGFGRKTLGLVLHWADEHGHTLNLTPTPFDDEGMTPEELYGFYAKYGFVWIPGKHRMVRLPHTGSPFYE